MSAKFLKVTNFINILVILGLFLTSCGSVRAPGDDSYDDIPSSNSDNDVYGQQVEQAITSCFFSHVTANGDEYVSATGVRFKNVSTEIKKTNNLTDADIANEIVWSGFTGVYFIYNTGAEWEEGDFGVGDYNLYKDGRIKTWLMSTKDYADYTCDILKNKDVDIYGFEK